MNVKRVFISPVVLAIPIGIILFLTFSMEAAGQTNSAAALLKMDFGSQGSTTELILTPRVGKPLRDPTWIYIVLPDGTRNTAFPAALPLMPIPVQPPLPSGLLDLSQLITSWNTSQKRTKVQDKILPMAQVLLPHFTVLASLEWQDSGIAFAAGQKFQISAQGNWYLDKTAGVPSDACGPDGLSTSNLADHVPLPGHPAWPKPDEKGGALIGRIGDGPAFLVGSGGVFTADRSGTLFLVCNDLFDGGAPGGSCVYCSASGNTHISNNTGELQILCSFLNSQ